MNWLCRSLTWKWETTNSNNSTILLFEIEVKITSLLFRKVNKIGLVHHLQSVVKYLIFLVWPIHHVFIYIKKLWDFSTCLLMLCLSLDDQARHFLLAKPLTESEYGWRVHILSLFDKKKYIIYGFLILKWYLTWSISTPSLPPTLTFDSKVLLY